MASNVSAGVSTGMQGAQLGGQFGGLYGAIIGGVAGFALGFSTPDYEKIAREKYNNEVVKNTATALFDLRRVQNIENLRTSQALIAYQDNRKVSQSQYTAQYGAADIIGSSADALNQVLDYQTEQAIAQTWFNYQTGIDNYNTSVESTVNSAMSGLRRTKGSTNQMDLGAITKQGLQMYNQYGSDFRGLFSRQQSTPSAIPVGGSGFSTDGIGSNSFSGLGGF